MDLTDDSETRTPVHNFSKRHELNNHIVRMRASVQQARVQTIGRVVHQIKRYKNRKGNTKEQEKAKRKASRLLEEIKILKKINKDKVSRHALLNTESLQEVLNNPTSSAEQRVLARLSHHPVIKTDVTKYRDANPNWDKQIPVLFAMTKSKRKNPGQDKSDILTKKETKSSKAEVKNRSELEISHSDSDGLGDNSISENDDDGAPELEPDYFVGQKEDGETSKNDSDSDSDSLGQSDPAIRKSSMSNVGNWSKAIKTNVKKQEALLPPVINKSVGSIKVQFLTDLKDLEDDDNKVEVKDKNVVDITQAPSTRRPKSSFFVGGEDEPESDKEDHWKEPKKFNQNPIVPSKPIYKKGKLVSNPPFQRSNFHSKRKDSSFNDTSAAGRFSSNTQPLGNKRPKTDKNLNFTKQPEKAQPLLGSAEKLHPSWEAKKKQQQISLTSFQGKKIVFDDDD